MTARREDATWLAEVGAAPDAQVVPLWRDQECGACGAATEPRSGGHVRACLGSGCGWLLFPRIEPAVIMVVESATDPERCLLARHRNSVHGRYSTLAGFVEVGESLVAFRAVAEPGEVQLDHNELVDARWFTRAELAAEAAANRLGREDSIDRVLLTSWLGDDARERDSPPPRHTSDSPAVT